MTTETIHKLIELNRAFYEDNADDFSVSRDKHYWDNFDLILSPVENNFTRLDRNNIFVIGNLDNNFLNKNKLKILDFGCGNGRVIEFLINDKKLNEKEIEYIGLDFSNKFLEITKKKVLELKETISNFSYELLLVDITRKEELNILDKYKDFDLIVGIAVMHHIPSLDLRKSIIGYLSSLLSKDGRIFLTTWNFLKNNSSLVVDPKLAGIDPIDLEDNDFILSWKNSIYRYLCFLDSPSEIF